MMKRFCVSEAKALTKWCPKATGHWDGGGEAQFQTNRYFLEDGKSLDQSVSCLGSRCMAWRWVETHIPDDKGDLNILSEDTHGYCGLAGDPR